jgi:hypothetical protein
MRFRPTGNRQQLFHSWMNDYGKLRRCTERSGEVVDYSALPGFPLIDS